MTNRMYDGLCVGGVADGEMRAHPLAVMSMTRNGRATTYHWQQLVCTGMKVTGFWIDQDATINDAMARMLRVYGMWHGKAAIPAAAE